MSGSPGITNTAATIGSTATVNQNFRFPTGFLMISYAKWPFLVGQVLLLSDLLTHNVEEYRLSEHWRGVDLALVETLVRVLDRLDHEHPVLGVGLVQDLESLVLDVLVLPNADQTHVVVTEPRYLQEKERKRETY